jgi:hypothetical protein
MFVPRIDGKLHLACTDAKPTKHHKLSPILPINRYPCDMHVNRAVPPKPCLFTALFFNPTQVLLIHIFIFIPITQISWQKLLIQEDLNNIPYRQAQHAYQLPPFDLLEFLAAWGSVLDNLLRDHGRFHPDGCYRASVATRGQDHGASLRTSSTSKENISDTASRRQELHHRASQQALRSEERLSRLQGAARDCCAIPLPRCQPRTRQS